MNVGLESPDRMKATEPARKISRSPAGILSRSLTGLFCADKPATLGIDLETNPQDVLARRRTRWIRWVTCLSWLNLAAVLVVMWLICFLSEEWWLSALMTYLPRVPYLFPTLILAVLALFVQPRLLWLHAVSGFVVLVPIMGLTAPVQSLPEPATDAVRIRLVSANTQEGQGSLYRLLYEIDRFAPNVVVLQETARGCDPLVEHFADWHTVHLGSYFVAAKFPIRVVDHCRCQAFDRWSAVVCEVTTPQGTFYLVDIHLMTPRRGASALKLSSLITGAGVEEFQWHQSLRRKEISEVNAFLEQFHDAPMLLAGDFNSPSTSSLYRDGWGDLQNTFDVAGTGYGYTSPCNTKTYWPPNMPWMRIDHILADRSWSIHEAKVGRTDSSDHRLIFAEVSMQLGPDNLIHNDESGEN